MNDLTPMERVRRLEDFVRERSGGAAVQVEGLRRMAGGASRQVWALDAVLDGGGSRLELVLRIDPAPRPAPGLDVGAGGLEGEFRLLETLHAKGLQVPRVYWLCDDPAWLGGPFYLMQRIEGETVPRRILRSEELAKAREELPEQLGRALAGIHGVDLAAAGLARVAGPSPGQSCVEYQLAQVRAGIDHALSPVPTLELAYRWLEQNHPPERDRALVHGDYRLGNVIVGPDGLRAILDWELAHVGDPYEDLAWMCTKTWRFGEIERPVGGLGQREPFYRSYEDGAGRRLEREELAYWELLSSARVAVVWIFQVRAYLGGTRPSVEHAAIGRRMAETELDLLELLSQR